MSGNKRILQLHLSIGRGGAYSVVKNISNGLLKNGSYSQEIFSNPMDNLQQMNYDGVLLHGFQGRYIDEYLDSLIFLERYKIPYIVLLHDYWPICLQTNLIRCNDGLKECKLNAKECNPVQCGFYDSDPVYNLDYVDISKNTEIYDIIKDSKTVCFCNNSVNLFKSRGFSNIKLIYHGIDFNLFKPYTKTHDLFTILFTNAWGKKILKGYKHWEWFKNHSIDICKELLGGKTLEYMPSFYNSGDCLLFLSLWPETCGLVVLEALACNIPVISYPVGIASDIITNGENGYIVDSYNISEIMDRVNDIKNRKLDCRDSVSHFTIENMSLEYIRFLSE